MLKYILLYNTFTLLFQMINCFNGKMPFWYPIGSHSTFRLNKPEEVVFMGKPLVAYIKNNTRLIVHSDICPHMGASFCKGGWINEQNNLQCPYHGFEFDEGKFVSIPSKRDEENLKINSHRGMPLMPVLEKNGYYYLFPEDTYQSVLSVPYFPPEHDDPSFSAVSGYKLLECPADSLVENLLDMLHISYVHSFGNLDIPLARNINYQQINEYAGRTSFDYSPNPNTISRIVGKADKVFVENEFHLPTTTLTRVKAGNITKTVFTQTLPISKDKTMLFWTVYRNFWRDPYIPEFTYIGDMLMKYLMEKTIEEDASILSRCYTQGRVGFLTKYDITIRKYRESRREFSVKN